MNKRGDEVDVRTIVFGQDASATSASTSVFHWMPASVLQLPLNGNPGTPGVELDSKPLVSPRYVLYGH